MSARKGRKRGLKLSNPRKLFMKKPVFDSLNSAELPKVPGILIQYILDNEEVMNTEGLFRVPGNASDIQAMLKTYSKRSAKPLDHTGYSVHTNACALKQWIRDMPDPLLTFELYDSWLACSKISDHTQHLNAVLRCVGLLPKANRALLKKLCHMLNEVLRRQEVNKMNARNLSIVFGPTILRSEDESDPLRLLDEQLKLNKTVEVLVGNFDDIFDKDSDNVKPRKPEAPSPQMTKQETKFLQTLQEGGVRIAKTIIVEQQKQSMQQLVSSRPAPAPEPWVPAAAKEGEPEKPFVFPPPPACVQRPNNNRRAQLVKSFSKAMQNNTDLLSLAPTWSNAPTPPCRRKRSLALSRQRAEESDEEEEEQDGQEEAVAVAVAPDIAVTGAEEEEEDDFDVDSALLTIEDIVTGIISGEMDTVQDYLASVECAEVVELHTDLNTLKENLDADEVSNSSESELSDTDALEAAPADAAADADEEEAPAEEADE
mmetsp:Transcript_2539/g.9026  ORF Transcript_2539/g.9026 Transcript_2539/m.9026 type:complete len:485 (+) Transcript_2539:106-1560(+)